MATIYDYLTRVSSVPFEKNPINEIDFAVFSWLSYIDYSATNNTTTSKRVYLKEAFEEALKIEQNKFFKNDIIKVMNALLASKRYENIEFLGYEERLLKDTTEQFAAVSMIIHDGNKKKLVITYRGTDGTVTGWKEDFEIVYKPQIPAQNSAYLYAKNIISEVECDEIYFCGHSKGGNLAIYAAGYFAKDEKLKAIYTYDSPGFIEDYLSTPEYLNVKPKIIHLTPQDSLVGRLLFYDYESIVVYAYADIAFEHLIFTWQVEGNQFIRVDKYSTTSNAVKKAMTKLINELDMTKREKAVQKIFKFVDRVSGAGKLMINDNVINFIMNGSNEARDNTDDLNRAKKKFLTFRKIRNDRKRNLSVQSRKITD